ncbi:MAG: ATP-binding protein [Pacificimonas sp.]|jgi:PAS domain S-box-containing protein|nr:ATP-binding protein [Pacificimonas sp.]
MFGTSLSLLSLGNLVLSASILAATLFVALTIRAERARARGSPAGEPDFAGIEPARHIRLLTLAERMAGIGYFRVDLTDESVAWSEELYHIHGRSVTFQPTVNAAIDLYHEDDRELVRQQLALAYDGQSYQHTGRIRRPDGSLRHVSCRGAPETDEEGRQIGIVGVVQDITAFVRQTEELTAARDEAEQAARAKGAFLAAMSHEIRTPMTGVLGMIELLQVTDREEDRAHFFASLDRSAKLLMSLLDDVLDYSKLESGHLVLEEKSFDVRALAAETVDLFKGKAARRGLSLGLSADLGTSGIVMGDPLRLRQVLTNLISNAVKFSAKGRVEIAVTAVPSASGRQHVTFTVSDTGRGIAADRLPAIFEPFRQESAATTREFGGTGLGLAICRELVEAMGGTLQVDSEEGEGSRFSFTLDLPDGAQVRAANRRAGSANPPRALNILLAEDNAVNRQLIQSVVERLGHSIVTVENGSEAVSLLKTALFDAVLMDMHMPVMDGVAATKAIRSGEALPNDVPIFALTADAAPERRRFYENIGLDDFLTKPIDVSRLEAALNASVGLAPGRHCKLRAVPSPDTPAGALPLNAVPMPTETPQADAGEGPADLIDRDHLRSLHDAIGPVSLVQIAEGFADEAARLLPAICRANAKGQQQDLRCAAHELKGVAGNCGCRALSAVAADLQALADEARATPGHSLVRDLTELAEASAAALSEAVAALTGETADSEPAMRKAGAV